MVIQGFTWIFLLIVLLANRAVCDGDAGSPPRQELPEWDPRSKFRCVSIPESMGVCSGIGYTEMRLPNMFNQDTIADVEDQTSIWIPLVKQICHREIRVFVCSIFAPPCVSRQPNTQIKPCQSLCHSVMRPCSAVMEMFGLKWPDNLDCAQFPPDTDLMCIKSKKDPNCDTCPPPDRITYDSIIGHYCVNKFVVMARIKRVHPESNGITKFQVKGRYLKFLKPIAPERRKIRMVVMETPSGCHCAALLAGKKNPRKKFILMGTVSSDGTMRLSQIIDWKPCSNPALRRAMRKIQRAGKLRKSDICQVSGGPWVPLDTLMRATTIAPSQEGVDDAD